MIIEFNFQNFLSFKDLTSFSMVAVKSFKEHPEHLIDIDEDFKLLKTSVVYGNNASGKSNFLKALAFMRGAILYSFRDALMDEEDRKFPLEKFALSTENEENPSYFEMTFITNNTKYRYGFELEYDKIVSEWLFHTTSREVYLFKRDGQEIEINKSSFKEGLGREKDLKENVLFLSLLATLGDKENLSSHLVNWFKSYNFISGINDRLHKRYTINKLKDDKEFFNWVLKFIKYLEITNISTAEEEVDEIDLETLRKKEKDEEIINLLSSIHKIQSKQPKRDQLITFHPKYNKDNILVDTVAFNFDEQESDGTRKLLYLLGPWYDSIKNNKILIIDELDSRLHTLLTKRLIDFFHKENNGSAQLIFALQNTSLLTKEIFRRDQIWFTEKNQYGASELYSLSAFKSDKVRKDSAFDKNYEEGRYGAIPYFNELEKIFN